MGVHKRQREQEEFKEHYIKKSSCYLLVFVALLGGAFMGNAITMIYMGNQNQGVQQVSSPAPQQSAPSANAGTLAQLESATASNPTNADAWIKLGNYCFDHNLPAKAAVAYEHAVELKPMNVGVWSDLGVMYRRTKQFNKAIDAFQHAADLDKNHIIARFNMGIVYLHDLGNREGALKAWKEVLGIDPNAKTPGGQPVSELIAELEGK